MFEYTPPRTNFLFIKTSNLYKKNHEASLGELNPKEIKISMDGKGRALDNIYIERLWRTVKRDYVYLNPADDGVELHQGLKKFFDHYNYEKNTSRNRKKNTCKGIRKGELNVRRFSRSSCYATQKERKNHKKNILYFLGSSLGNGSTILQQA